MSYSCLEELQVSLNLNLSDKTKILSDAGCRYNDKWLIVTDDGNCHLFGNDGNLDDIAKVKWLDKNCIKRDIKKIIVPCDVTYIGESAFSDCSSLINVTISDSVTYIGYSAFAYCISLTSVVIPDSVTTIGSSAFSDCRDLIHVTIPNSVIRIGDWAFSICSDLTSVTIPDSVTKIGDGVFYGCSKLTNVMIDNDVTSIGYSAFENCNNIKSLVFKGKTLAEVRSMENYPWGIIDQSIIRAG